MTRRPIQAVLKASSKSGSTGEERRHEETQQAQPLDATSFPRHQYLFDPKE